MISVAMVTAPFVVTHLSGRVLWGYVYLAQKISDASVVAMETNGSKDLFEMSVNCVSGPPQWDFMHGLMEIECCVWWPCG